MSKPYLIALTSVSGRRVVLNPVHVEAVAVSDNPGCAVVYLASGSTIEIAAPVYDVTNALGAMIVPE